MTNSLVLPGQDELREKTAILVSDRRTMPFVTSGQTFGVCLRVVAGEKELSVTLVWTDPPPGRGERASLLPPTPLRP